MDIVVYLEHTCNQNIDAKLPPRLAKYGELFRCAYEPSLSLSQYMSMLIGNMDLDEATYRIAKMYLERLNAIYPIQTTTAHKQMFVALLIAKKYHEDDGAPNSYYAEIGGLSSIDLMNLEIAFCYLTAFRLYVKPENYFKSIE